MKFKKVVLNGLVLGFGSLLLIASGGSGGGGGDSSIEGYLVDSPIKGANYECVEGSNGITDKEGKFKCKNIPVTFRIGGLEIGTISSLPKDKKVYPQDLMGVSRDNYTDDKLILLTRFLQSLDNDGVISENIDITEDVREKFAIGEFIDLSEEEVKGLLEKVGKNLVSQESALSHLRGDSTTSSDDITENHNQKSNLSFIEYKDSKLDFMIDTKGLGILKGDELRVTTLAYSDKDNKEADYGDGTKIIVKENDFINIEIPDFTFSLLADSEDTKKIEELPIVDRSRGMFEIIGQREYQGLSVCIQKVTKDNGHEINGEIYYGNIIGQCNFVSNKDYIIHSKFSLKSITVEPIGEKRKVIVKTEGKLYKNIVAFFEFVKTDMPTLPYMNSLAKVYPTKDSENSFSFIIPDKISSGEQQLKVVTFGKDGYSQISWIDFVLE